MIFRKAIAWEALDWARFFQAGGVLTVDAWERATPASRAACLLARQALQDGLSGIGPDDGQRADHEARVAALSEVAKAMAAQGPGEVRA